MVDKMINTNVGGMLNEIVEAERARIQQEAENVIRKANQKLAELEQEFARLRAEAEKQAAAVADIERDVLNIRDGIQTATLNTHIGAEQCLDAVGTVINACRRARSALGDTSALPASMQKAVGTVQQALGIGGK